MSTTTQSGVGFPTRRPWPLVGHLVQFQRRPLEFFGEVYQQPEPVVQIQMGRTPAYVLTTPELILRILRGKEAHSVEKGPFFDALRATLGDGLITSAEPKHLRHRRLMQPAFHRDNIAGYVQIMQAEAAAVFDTWCEGDTVAFDRQMQELSMRISAKALFASDIGAEAVTETQRSYPVIMAKVPLLTFLPWLKNVPLVNHTLNTAVARLSGVITRIIAHYRAADKDYGDLISMLLAARFEGSQTGLTDEQLRDEVMAIYAASVETTGSIMSFALLEATRRPDIRAKLEREITEVLAGGPVTIHNIRQLIYTEKLVAETLRRYTPLWLSMRVPTTDFEIDGIAFPAGSTLIYSPYTLHNDPRYFPNPEVFDPDRWSMDYRKTITRSGVYQPFGAGNRTCIGEPFAWFEAVTVIATLAQRLWLQPASNAPMHEVAKAALEINHMPMTIQRREAVLGSASP